VANDLELKPVAGGTRLRVRVKPGARKTAIGGAHGGALRIAVAAVAERGKANRAVVEALAEALGLPASSVTIVSGKTSQDKVVDVALSVAAVCTLLVQLERPKR
jgi:uncharacterized protein (TIGR00251 family)